MLARSVSPIHVKANGHNVRSYNVKGFRRIIRICRNLLFIVTALPLIAILSEKIREMYIMSLRKCLPVNSIIDSWDFIPNIPYHENVDLNTSSRQETSNNGDIDLDDSMLPVKASTTSQADMIEKFANKYGFNRREN